MCSYEITSAKQYYILHDAVKNYELEQKAKKKNLAGTYWKEPIHNKETKQIMGHSYYFVERHSMDGGSVFEINVYKNGEYKIYSNASISPIMYAENTIEHISAEQFKSETKIALERYGMVWK